MNRSSVAALMSVWFVTVTVAFGDETLTVLQAGSEVYSNVTVTSVSATDVYFTHSGGIGNAKLKNLAGELQKHFHYDAVKSGLAEQQQHAANTEFRTALLNAKPAAPPPPPTETVPAPVTGDDGDLIVPKLYARSFRGQRPPQIFVDEWLTAAPEVSGKFVLVEFWATWCGPCRKSIPHLNELQSKFKDRLVVIGLSYESPDAMRKATTLPPVQYFVGTDPSARTMKAVEVQGIPHAMLMDQQGIVRFEGMPDYLDDAALQHLLDKYAK